MPLIAVFDTNILISATGWKGSPFQCIELSRAGTVQGITCAEILLEFAEKLETKLAFPKEQADEAVADVLSFLRVVRIEGKIQGVARDPDDDKVLECAVAGAANYIVSGDKDLLTLGSYAGIGIVRASEFLKITVAVP